MAKGIRANTFNLFPKGLVEKLVTNRIGHRFLLSLVRQQDVKIPLGTAKGLHFNPGLSNPEYAFGNNEIPVQQAIEAHLHEGDVYYDIGANVGFFTMIGAKKVGLKGWVYAFEPLPANAKIIENNISINGFRNTTLVQKAVSDRSGRGELLVAQYSGGSALSTANAPPPDLAGTMMVDLVSIDDFLDGKDIRPPSLMKIDVEGAELDVFIGMAETLKRYKPMIIYEIDDGRLDAYEFKAAECQSYLEKHNYMVTPLEKAYADIQWIVGHFVASYKG